MQYGQLRCRSLSRTFLRAIKTLNSSIIFTIASSSTTSECESASDRSRDKSHYDPKETDAEALFRSLSRFGEVNAESIAQVSSDLRALMAGLRTEGKLDESED